MNTDDAQQLRKASAHWFRLTHATHALTGRPRQFDPVRVRVVRINLRHASLGTTSGYMTTEVEARLVKMKRVDVRRESRRK